MATPKVVIFDFDGTLADTAPLMRKIYAGLVQSHDLKAMSDEDYAMLRKGTLTEARRWSGARWWQVPLMYRSVKKLMITEAENVKLFHGVPDMIRDLHEQGTEMYILSRNTSETIARTLERYKLQKYLHILPRRRWTLGDKARVISSLVRQQSLSPQSVWMIGDEVRDIQAANKARVSSIAVSWGLQDESILARYQPTHSVTSIEELHQALLTD